MSEASAEEMKSGGDSQEQQGDLGMPWAAFPSCCPTLTAGEMHQIHTNPHRHTHRSIYFINLVSLSHSYKMFRDVNDW